MSEQLSRHEEASYAQKELGKRVLSLGEQLEARALTKIGINRVTFSGSTDYTVTLQSFHRPSMKVEVGGPPWGALYPDGILRRDRKLISVKASDEAGNTVIELGRFIDPDGNMYQAADSSQGKPWYDANLPLDKLATILNCLETIEAVNHTIEVNLTKTVWHPSASERTAAP